MGCCCWARGCQNPLARLCFGVTPHAYEIQVRCQLVPGPSLSWVQQSCGAWKLSQAEDTAVAVIALLGAGKAVGSWGCHRMDVMTTTQQPVCVGRARGQQQQNRGPLLSPRCATCLGGTQAEVCSVTTHGTAGGDKPSAGCACALPFLCLSSVQCDESARADGAVSIVPRTASSWCRPEGSTVLG